MHQQKRLSRASVILIGLEEDEAETNRGCQLTFKLYDPELKNM